MVNRRLVQGSIPVVATVALAGLVAFNHYHKPPAPRAPIAQTAPIVEGPHLNDRLVDRRFGEESPRSPNFDITPAGYCGDGVIQSESTTRDARSGSIIIGRITGSGSATTKVPDTQLTSYGSGRTETVDGANNTEMCLIDTAMRGNGVCDRNTGEYEQRTTLALRTYPMWVRGADSKFQTVLPSFEYRPGQFVTNVPIDESAQFLTASGVPAVGVNTMPSGGRLNPFYAPQDCQPAPVRVRVAPAPREQAPSIQNCSPSILTDRLYRQIERRLSGVIGDQRQGWVQNADGTYRASFVLRSSNGNLSASSPSCSGPSACRLNLSPVNDTLSTLTGLAEDLTCRFTMGN